MNSAKFAAMAAVLLTAAIVDPLTLIAWTLAVAVAWWIVRPSSRRA